MLWVSHGVSEQNSRRAAHTAQPGSLTPPAISAPPPTGTRPCLALLAGQSWWGQLLTLLRLTHCCPARLCCKGSSVPAARLTRLVKKPMSDEVEGCAGGKMDLSGSGGPKGATSVLWATAARSLQHSTTWHRNARFLELLC